MRVPGNQDIVRAVPINQPASGCKIKHVEPIFNQIKCGPLSLMNLYNQEMLRALSRDPVLKRIVKKVPPEKLYLSDADGRVREHLIASIISQQLSVQVARVINRRFLDLFPSDFPSNQQILSMATEDLRSVGLSGQKASYIRNIAEHFTEHKWKNEDFHDMGDEEIIVKLSQIKGVGRWTAEMVLIFCLGRPDVFAADDLGIQMSMKAWYQIDGDRKSLIKTMKDQAEKWKPFRTAASLYLWAAKDLKIEI